jgi:hypothetical protein
MSRPYSCVPGGYQERPYSNMCASQKEVRELASAAHKVQRERERVSESVCVCERE